MWGQVERTSRGTLATFLLLSVMGTTIRLAAEETEPADAGVRVTKDSVVRFAGAEEARKHLAEEDAFLKALSPFDLQSRLGIVEGATKARLIANTGEQVRDWSDEEKQQVSKVLNSIAKRLETLELPFPETILLIKTTGKEEGNAAYCRRNAVILPQQRVSSPPRSLERLVIHELFHVLSSHNEKLRNQLYEIVGFRPCNEVALPAALKDRKITNPDAPITRHYITLEHDGKDVLAAPILYASVDQYDPEKGGSFFRYLKFELLLLERVEGKLRPLLKDGKPILLNPRSSASYFEKIGKNTNYIIHPDEILADNFVHLVLATEDLKTPRIIEQMRAALQKP